VLPVLDWVCWPCCACAVRRARRERRARGVLRGRTPRPLPSPRAARLVRRNAVRVVIGTVARTGSTARAPARPARGPAAAPGTATAARRHWPHARVPMPLAMQPRTWVPSPTVPTPHPDQWRASGAPVGYVRNAQHSGQRCLTGVTQPRSTQRTYSVGVLHPRRPCRLTILIHCRRRAF